MSEHPGGLQSQAAAILQRAQDLADIVRSDAETQADAIRERAQRQAEVAREAHAAADAAAPG